MGSSNDTNAQTASGGVDPVESNRIGAELEQYASILMGLLDDLTIDPSVRSALEERAQATAQSALAWQRPIVAAKLWSVLGYHCLRSRRRPRLQDALVYLMNAVDLMRDRHDADSDLVYALSSLHLAQTYARLPVTDLAAVVPVVVEALNGAAARLPADNDAIRAQYLSTWGDLVAHSKLGNGLRTDDIVRARNEAADYLATPDRGGAQRYLAAWTAGVAALRLGELFDARKSLREAYEGAIAAQDHRTVATVLKQQGDAARSRSRGHGIDAADLHFQSAAAYDALDDPTEAADAYRTAGMLYLEHSEWHKAADTFRASQERAERSLLRAAADLDIGERTWRRSGVLQALCFALARLGDTAGAAEAADRARAWKFRSMPRVGSAQFQHALDQAPELASASLDLHTKILDAERREGDARDAPDEQIVAKLTGIADELVDLRTALEDLRKRMAHLPGAKGVGDPSSLDRIRAALPVNAVGVYIIATRYSGLAILIGKESVNTLDLPELTDEATSVHRSAVTSAYDAARSAGPDPGPVIAWDQLIESTCQWLWTACMGPILDAAGNTERLVLFPSDGLDFLPLHAAWHGAGSAREYVVDRVAVSYAPCAELLPQVPVADNFCLRRAVVIGNPQPTSAPPLPGAELEADAIGSGFASRTILLKAGATIENVMECVAEADILHFACHGFMRMDRPYATYILLASDRRLTLSHIVEAALPGRPSVFVSACETALHDFELADEVQSLSSAFLAAGARDVISTLWSIDDVSAVAVATRIYDARLRGSPGPEALREAQRWMRDTPKEQKAADVLGFAWMEPAVRERVAALLMESTADHSRPQHWAAHVYCGAP